MAIITRLYKTTVRSKKVRVYLDDRYAFSLPFETASRLALQQELSPEQVGALTRAGERQTCLASAQRFLSNRPHSEQELRQKLLRRGFKEDDISGILTKLKQAGLVNDALFAAFWAENREAFKPRGKRLTAGELRQKGVAPEVISRVVEPMDESEGAYRAARLKAAHLASAERDTFRRKLGDYLLRRGFGYDIIRQTVDRLWREKEAINSGDEPSSQ